MVCTLVARPGRPVGKLVALRKVDWASGLEQGKECEWKGLGMHGRGAGMEILPRSDLRCSRGEQTDNQSTMVACLPTQQFPPAPESRRTRRRGNAIQVPEG